MPPTTQTSVTRRGRPAKADALNTLVAVMDTPNTKKRGRPAKTDVDMATAVEPPKKRGRPAKAQIDASIPHIDHAIKRGRRSIAAAEEAVADVPVPIKRRAGRPAKATPVAEKAVTSKRSAGRPRKGDAEPEAPATPKRRGRPALDLKRVAGSSRVTKRNSPRSKITARAPAKIAPAPRINPKMRSRLRIRAAPVEKASNDVVEPVKKARGRPKKVEVDAVSAPKRLVGRGHKVSAPAPVAPAKKVTARPKTAVPRKRRGYTSFEVADKFAAQIKQFILDLQAEDAANAAAAAGEADDEGEDIEIEVELGPEEADTREEVDAEEAAPELTEMEVEDEGENILTEAVEDAETAGLAHGDDDFDDETELPSETAVLAEIAAVQDELDVQDEIEEDVDMAAEGGLERQSSASHDSVDLHEEITEVSSIPQGDGSNEIEVFHAHVDTHEHVFQTFAPKPTAGASLEGLFSGA